MNSRETFHEHYANSLKPSKSELDTDMELRGREMAEDPMLEYFREKQREKLVGAGKPAGKPIYRGQYPPNRYNIRPGYRWDGVNRSNGFEKKLMDEQANKIASEEDSYRWATRDL